MANERQTPLWQAENGPERAALQANMQGRRS